MSAAASGYEKLGAFYLGRRYDPEAGVTAEPYLYDSKDLTTHAVCVGMTGSGKTGLCVSLLEEAALDGVPALILDPKGDLGNLLLTFPDLAPADFRPWVDEGEARRRGVDVATFARQTSGLWRKGLGDWGQDGDRIRRLRASADFSIYTPGSTAGMPLTALRSFSAPGAAVVADAEALSDRVEASASGLLALLGLDADPITSPEHILIANILERSWREGRGLDLAGLIRAVQSPPFDKLGVLDLESFLPSDRRFQLAMRINNVLASPSFATWLEGDPLDIGRLLFTESGKPRVSVLSIAHLSESERMFFVTLLLNELLAWVRTQPGTSSLRALLYMDEIFGFFPPTAAPPSKKPMLTLLKQARAYGLGVVLATQNPVDLDYKGLANTGTWFIGRLQTERDKMRVLEGLEGASAASGADFEASRMEQTLAGLGSRVFLAHNVHEDAPLLFHTRWAMSYLRGPLTRSQIETLMADKKALRQEADADHAGVPAAAPQAPASPTAGAAPGAAKGAAEAATETRVAERPVLPPGVEELFLPLVSARGDRHRLLWRPALLARSRLHFVRASAKADEWQERLLIGSLPDGGAEPTWDLLSRGEGTPEPTSGPTVDGGDFAPLPAAAQRAGSYKTWRRELVDHLYRGERLVLFKCAALKAVSRAGESEGEFRGRLALAARERRDLEVEKVRKRFSLRLATLADRVRRAEEKVHKEQGDVGRQKIDTVLSIGATLAGALFGRKLASVGNVTRTRSAIRGFGQAAKEKEQVGRAERELEAQRDKLEDMEALVQDQVAGIESSFDPEALDLESIEVPPRKSDIDVADFALVWTPWRVDAAGVAERLF
jgi:DNA helicase HerA-like ATPase